YAGMMAHFLLIALARSLIMGASSAYLYEWLAARGEASRYKVIEGDARFWSLVARVGCWAVVGYVMAVDLFLPYWLSAASAALALGTAWLLPAVAAAALPSEKGSSGADNLRIAARAVREAPILLVIMAQGVGVFV